MSINTTSFNTKQGEIIPIDDIDDKIFDHLMLSESEVEIKRMLWDQQNAEYEEKFLKKRYVKWIKKETVEEDSKK